MMEGYKGSDLGIIPYNWNIKTLGDISRIVMGQSPSSSSYNSDGNGSYLIQGNADIKNRLSAPRQWTTQPTKYCEVGDTLMTVRAPVGTIAKAVHQACIGRGVCAFKATNLDNEYLYQFLLSYENKWKALEQGSTFTAVNGTEIKGIKIPIPPLPEQQKIADILSTVDAKIDNIDQQITETQELKKGLMQRLLTKGIGHSEFKNSPLGKIPESWNVVKFGKLISNHSYGPRFSSNDYSKTGNVKTIRGTDINKTGDILYQQVPTASLPSDFVEDHKLRDGDLVMITTADCGLTGVFFNQGFPFIPSAYAVRITLNEKAFPLYFKYIFQTTMAKNQVNRFIRKGTVANLPGSDILKFEFPCPSFEEQQEIAEILNSVDEKLEILSETKTTYQELKKGLMQQLLTGKVRVKV